MLSSRSEQSSSRKYTTSGTENWVYLHLAPRYALSGQLQFISMAIGKRRSLCRRFVIRQQTSYQVILEETILLTLDVITAFMSALCLNCLLQTGFIRTDTHSNMNVKYSSVHVNGSHIVIFIYRTMTHISSFGAWIRTLNICNISNGKNRYMLPMDIGCFPWTSRI